MARTTTTSTTSHHPSFRPPRHTSSGSFSSNVAVLSVDRIPSIPGFKTSAAFLSSLGANLRIPDSDLLPSPLSTPSLHATSDTFSNYLPPPSPLPLPVMSPQAPVAGTSASTSSSASQSPNAPTDPHASIPSLTTYSATTDEDLTSSLKLIADSIAQQRQTASRVLIFHPMNVALFGLLLALIAQHQYRSRSDLPLVFTTCAGLIMAALAGVRYFTRGYIFAAEELKWDWLEETDTVLVTRFGDEVIACCVVGWERTERVGVGRKKKGLRGVIRAWTVRLRYRGKGVGKALLEEAVELASEKGAEEVVFAEDHANHRRFLFPDFYNAAFDRREVQANDTLDTIAAAKGIGIGRRT